MVDLVGINFDADPNAPREFPLIPDGSYTMYMSGERLWDIQNKKEVTLDDFMASNKTNADALIAEFTILGGTQDGKKLSNFFNLWYRAKDNSEENQKKATTARDMSAQDWKYFVLGVLKLPGVKQSTEMHNKKFKGQVLIEPDKQGKARNKILFREWNKEVKQWEARCISTTLSGVTPIAKPTASVAPAAAAVESAQVATAKVAVAGTKKAPWD